MSTVGVLENPYIVDEDEWIEIASSTEAPIASPTSPVLSAIANLKDSIANGVYGEVLIDTDEFGEMDELDDAAIRAFFEESD